MALTFQTMPLAEAGPLRHAQVDTAWTTLAFLCRGETVIKLFWATDGDDLRRKLVGPAVPPSCLAQDLLPGLQQALVDYFAGIPVTFDCRVDLSWASPFCQAVLRTCCRVPLGRTISYGQLACRVGRPRAARAVGAIMAANRTALLIPCHRVVAADGSLGGYSAPGGPAMKSRLLAHETALSAVRAAANGTGTRP